MIHRASSALTSAALLLALVVPVGATPADRISFAIDETFQSGFLTSRCGTPVWVHVQGTGTMLLFYDNSGQLIREMEVMPGGADALDVLRAGDRENVRPDGSYADDVSLSRGCFRRGSCARDLPRGATHFGYRIPAPRRSRGARSVRRRHNCGRRASGERRRPDLASRSVQRRPGRGIPLRVAHRPVADAARLAVPFVGLHARRGTS